MARLLSTTLLQLGALLERHRGVWQLFLAAVTVAWLLTKTSASLLGNVPLAVLSVLSLRWAFSCLERQQRARLLAGREARLWRHEAPPCTPAPTFGVPPSAAKPDSWRKFVRASVVEEAWARFCGSIVQEFIYDTWYTVLTPDKEFPAEVRRLLNTAFGQLALRARQLDLRLVLNDLSELFMEQLELYRDTRESILLATQQPHCLRDMSQAARDRAFQQELKAEKNLHPALLMPDGHYKFLKAVAEGAVAYLLETPDLSRPAPRVVCRELLASCVFRPLMMYSAPYYYNKALYALLQETRQKQPSEYKEAKEISPALAAARSESMRGHWEFEQRLLQHVAAEDSALLAARELRQRLHSQLSQHTRSRSMDMLPTKLDLKQPQQAQQQHKMQQQASQEQQDHRMHPRAHSCSPVELAATRSSAGVSAGAAPVAGAGATSGRSTSTGSSGGIQRGTTAANSGQVRPPRPPPVQLPRQHEKQQQAEERSAFDMFNVASAVAAALLSSTGSAAAALQKQQQQQGDRGEQQETPRLAATPGGWRLPDVIRGLLPLRGHQQAEAEEAVLLVGGEGDGDGDGWESVEASEASLTIASARRDFSSAHLLAPLADQREVEGVTPRATTSSDDASGAACSGFSGPVRAKVVAADLNTSSSKDFVEFKIRVAAAAEEWTVSRRYRNFESLHRQLRIYPSYHLRLPPKRIFVHSNNVEFVEERREQLDKYLQILLLSQELSKCSDLYEFLCQGSQLYELASPQQQRLQAFRRAPSSSSPQQQCKVLDGLSRAALDGAHSVGRGITSASGAVAGSVKQSVSEMATAASGGIAKVTSGVAGAADAVRGSLSGSVGCDPRPGMARRMWSVPNGLDRVSGSSTEEGSLPGARVQHGSSGSARSREKGSGLLSRAGNCLRSTMSRELSAQQQQYQQLEPSGHSGSCSSVDSEQLVAEQLGRPALSMGRAASASLSHSPAKMPSKLFSSLRRSKSRSTSPTKQVRERSPARKPRRDADSISFGGSWRNSGELPAQEGELGATQDDLPEHLVSSLRCASPGPTSPLTSFPVEPSLDLEDCAGVSDPLFECVDCLFQLQTRGYFRRQVFGAARQVLSLVAGEAIDAYLNAKLRLLRQQHTIGRIISQIQASLWPGGVWFQYTPAAQAAAAAQRQRAQQQQQQHGSQASPAPANGSGCGKPGAYVRPAGMEPEKYLEPGGPPPLDEEEIREAVEALLLRRAPSTLVRLIGKNAYASGMQDMFDMLQSQAFCHHLGYGCLEVAMVHLLPELKGLFRTLQHGGLG